MSSHQKTISSYFEEYLLECKYTKRLSSHTMKSYGDVIKNFLTLMPEVITPMDLKPYVVHEFFKRLGERAEFNKKELKASTIRTYFNKLIVFFKWLESNEFIEKKSLTSKITKPPNPTYHDGKALHDEEVTKIISSISLHNLEDEFMLKRDLVIVKTLLYTGIRKGELLGLRIQDIDFSGKMVFVNGKTSKSKKSRYIPLHFSLLTDLKFYLKMRENRNFNNEYLIVSTKKDRAYTEHGMKFWVKKYNKLSGVKFHLHQFRHTFACNLAIQGTSIISIKNLLGHSTTQMTEQRTNGHTVSRLSVHLVWSTKYRYPVLKGDIQIRCRKLMIQICDAEDITILKGVVSKDHIHMHIEYRPSQNISTIVKKLKGRSSRKLQQEYPELKKRYWGRHFWAIGFGCWSTGNITDKMVNEYLEHHRT